MRLLAVAVWSGLAAAVVAQNRVYLGGVPTNLSLDLSMTAVVPDPTQPDAFLALMPLSTVVGFGNGFAAFDGTFVMNQSFGTGNWLRCTMTAVEWAYISDSACAHAPGPGYSAPLSLLTTDYDYGAYQGVVGTPFLPWPNASYFVGSFQSQVGGYGSGLTPEHWQLRTRGWNTTDLWNGCGPSPSSVTPTFPGWLVARFAYVFS
jgi:hypothetical protein